MPPENQNAVEEFFKGLPTEDQRKADIFQKEDAPAEASDKEEKNDPDEGEGRKNRHYRRVERALEKEREARIAAEARASALAEMRQTADEHPELDPRLVQMYGDNVAASKLHQELLNDFAKRGREDALKEMEQRQAQKAREDAELESIIYSELDNLEEEFGIDLTSNAPAAKKTRTEFLNLVENLSPKDQDGSPTDFADFRQTWDIYQNMRKTEAPAAPNRAKDLAARSMERTGGGSSNSSRQPTPGFDGWKRDFGIE